jgi:predicted small metal-binding protein
MPFDINQWKNFYNIYSFKFHATLKCSDAGFDCSRIIPGDDEQEIMNRVIEHASKDHGLKRDDVDQQTMENMKKLIKSN